MKKIMILGAGVYQVPLIETARRMGLHTIVVSIDGNYPGFAIADQIYYEDTTDYETIMKIARDEAIDGIITAGTDVAVITVGKVCDELGLSGISFEAAQIASNKLQMKDAYEAAGVRTAKYRKVFLKGVFDRDDYIQQIEGLQFPLIFKVVDSSGSRGIEKVDSVEVVNKVIASIKPFTKLDYFVAEEFLEGEEFGAQAFIKDGKLQFILPHGDYVFRGDTGVPIGHWVPYNIADEIIEDSKKQLQLAAEAMKLNNCAMNVDFILCQGKTYVLEIGGRSGATCLSEMVSIYYGFDYYEKMIHVALGEDVSFESDLQVPCAAMLLSSDKTGKIKKQVNEAVDDYVLDVQFDYNVGDEVHAFRIGPHRIGHVIVTGDDLDEAIQNLDTALGKVKIEVED